ncbi:hypothetical protein [Aquimarina spongiae]|uniref:DUF4149 domain-containing protein n=1 Tax=Aquimarina spongiae TaxID=570521 RepID=A0A1M6J6E6_9FLAO|nr:hypothetical protein [Aquimarina spongiae]SHJ42231.1 hypothetical protein SAMN04488508_108275 [Aquimarina spongiae]
MKKYLNINIAVTFIWIGFVCAISFMEAWLKFQADGVTTPIGLSIGKLVFTALNKVEIGLAVVLVFTIFRLKSGLRIPFVSPYIILPFTILLLQTLWLLPVLDQRAEQIISGVGVSDSSIHLWYVLLEIGKTASLFIYGSKLLGMMKVTEETKE